MVIWETHLEFQILFGGRSLGRGGVVRATPSHHHQSFCCDKCQGDIKAELHLVYRVFAVDADTSQVQCLNPINSRRPQPRKGAPPLASGLDEVTQSRDMAA
jgi:hypothetical protein